MAKDNNTRKYLIWGSATILVATGGFLVYRWFKNRDKQDKERDGLFKELLDRIKNGKDKEDETPTPPPVYTPSASSGGNSAGNSSSPTLANPFKNEAELKEFQTYVIEVKGDKKILAPYNADGKWGGKSSDAYKKYGDDFKEFKNPKKEDPKPNPTISDALEKDIDLIQLLAEKGANRTKESYLRSVAITSPDYIRNWANALRLRMQNPTSGTYFIFSNNIYDSYRGDIASESAQSSRIMIGKNVVAWGANPKLRQTYLKNSPSIAVVRGANLGQVKAFFYNNDIKYLFAYVPDNSTSSLYKWILASDLALL